MSSLTLVTWLLLSQARTVLVVTVDDASWEPFEQRLVAEIEASGLRVEVASKSGMDSRVDVGEQLHQLALRTHALVVLWVQPFGDFTELWLLENATSRLSHRRYPTPKDHASRARLALRAVELLHVSLLESVRKPAEWEDEELLMPESRAPLVQPHFFFGVGAEVLFGWAAGGVMWEWFAGYTFSRWWQVEAEVATTVVALDLKTSSPIGLTLFRAWGRFTPLRMSRFSLGVGLGGGAAAILASASGPDGGPWLASGRLWAGYRVRSRIEIQLLGGISVFPKGDEWQRPFYEAALRVEFE